MLQVEPRDFAGAYGQTLLNSLQLEPLHPLRLPGDHPAVAWAGSGLMQLTGEPQGPPTMCPVPLAACADGAFAALAGLAPAGALDGWRGAPLLAERAAILGLRRNGAVSPGGGCRLYRCGDGWIALNLVRDEDRELLPAWLEAPGEVAPAALPQLIRGRRARELVERGRLLGLAVAEDAMPPGASPGWFTVDIVGEPGGPRRAPRVVELASLWAGPLCGRLLQALGAEVIKVESLQRPDGARRGNPQFFERLNAGKRCVSLDFAAPAGLEQLRGLIADADIVVEGSRPRALRQLGIEAEALLRRQPGLTWLSISGYGRGEPQEHWVAYGDDAGVAAGLSSTLHAATGLHLICGDAIADPLTGIHAALAAWASYLQGGGRLLALALRDVMAHGIACGLPATAEELRRRQAEWSRLGLPGARTPALQ